MAQRVVLFGDLGVMERASNGAASPVCDIVATTSLAAEDAAPGAPSDAGARAQVAYLEAAVAAARAGEIQAIVTAPISKTQARRAGFAFPGHTEFLAERLGAARFAMMFAGPRLKVVLATVHLPLAEVAAHLTVAVVRDATELAVEALRRDFGVESPRVGVVGLNPHAGEGGLFGREELDVIAPAIEAARATCGGAQLSGPLVPDAAFRAGVEGRYDVLVSMYHDQALIPIKLIDFDRSVNCTIGLPVVRTSPDHGTAYDIAGQGIARAEPMQAALELAADILDRRGA